MMKFFRKHNKKLLAIFMALLMIVFVGGSALESVLMPDPGSIKQFESSLGPITRNHVEQAKSTTSILGLMGLSWRQPYAQYGVRSTIEELDWVLLRRESLKLGFEPNAEAVKTALTKSQSAEAIEATAYRYNIKPDSIYWALAEFDMIKEVAFAMARANAPSESEIRLAVQATLDKVKIRVVTLPARSFIDGEAEIPESELEEHFLKYRDVEPGTGLKFGYLVPPSIKVQYLKIERDSIAASIKKSADEVEALGTLIEKKARKFFDENQKTDRRFKRSDTSSDEEGPAPPEFLDWEEAREIAIEGICSAQAEETAERIANWLVLQVGEPWAAAERGDDRYHKLPEGVDSLDHYEKLLSNLHRKLSYPEALSVKETDFFTSEKAWQVPEIGQARGAAASGVFTPPSLRSLAFRCQGITPIPEKGSPSDYLALFQTSRIVLRDGNGNLFVFRAIDIRDRHPADSVDEVRDQVVEDVRLLRGFEASKTRARELMQATRTLGSLNDAFHADEVLASMRENKPNMGGIGFQEPEAFARVMPAQAANARTKPDRYLRGLGVLPGETVEEFFALEQAADPIAVLELREDRQPKVLVVQWLETISGREDEYEEARGKIATTMTGERLQTSLAEWFKPENIRARNAWAVAPP